MRVMIAYGVCSAAVVLCAACGPAASGAPTGPTAVTNPTPPPAAAAGNIRVAAVTHASGETLKIADCGPSFTGIPGTHRCNEDWHAAFDVTSTVDLVDGYLTVGFEAAGKRCGTASVGSQSFAAGRERLVGTIDPVYVTHEREGYDNLAVEQACELPATTDRLVVQLWDPRRPSTPVVRRDFDYVFTFVE